MSWRLLFPGHDISQEVFNLCYHLGQDRSEVMAWPIRERLRYLQLLDEQFDFEKEQIKKSRQ